MVDFAPFPAIRYDTDIVGEIAGVIAPPYDVIKPKLQDELYAKSGHNIVRVDLNRPEDGDSELARYERAQKTLSAWLESGAMKQDDEPGFYVLAQTFVGPDGVERTRTGFFGKARLTRFGEGDTLPHERTLKGPKLDRLRLFRATKTNLSPIFGMYRDPDSNVLAVLEGAMKDAPTITAEMDGVKNRLWKLSDEKSVDAIRGALSTEKLYIADGHHRYETGLAYRDERRSAPPSGDSDPGYESILIFAAAVEDPGMVVFPTHRLVHSLASWNVGAFDEKLAPFFSISRAPDAPSEVTAALAEAGADGRTALVMVTDGRKVMLRLRDDAPLDTVADLPEHPAVRSLDVTILHSLVLEHLLGVSKEAQATQSNLRYSKSTPEALTSVDDMDDVQIAFLMNPTKVQEVIDISNAGEVMPQKSTFFYPKIPSGLVLYPLD